MQAPPPMPIPSANKVYQEEQPSLDSLKAEFIKLESELSKHLASLGERVVQIRKADHPVFSKELFMNLMSELGAAEAKKDEAKQTRRKFFGVAAATGLAMTGVGTGLGLALGQLLEESKARKEDRVSEKIDTGLGQFSVGVLFGGLASLVVYNHLQANSDLQEKESQALQVITNSLLEKERLIKYCENAFIEKRITTPNFQAEVFVNKFLTLVNRMSKLQEEINKLSN